MHWQTGPFQHQSVLQFCQTFIGGTVTSPRYRKPSCLPSGTTTYFNILCFQRTQPAGARNAGLRRPEAAARTALQAAFVKINQAVLYRLYSKAIFPCTFRPKPLPRRRGSNYVRTFQLKPLPREGLGWGQASKRGLWPRVTASGFEKPHRKNMQRQVNSKTKKRHACRSRHTRNISHEHATDYCCSLKIRMATSRIFVSSSVTTPPSGPDS